MANTWHEIENGEGFQILKILNFYLIVQGCAPRETQPFKLTSNVRPVEQGNLINQTFDK